MNPILGKWGALLGLLAASTGTVAVETGAASWPKADPAAIANWQAKRFGMFIHFGPVSLTGREIGWSRGNETPIAVYDNLYRQFNPTNFNAETWVSVAKAAGMKYIVLTTKHHDDSVYGIRNSATTTSPKRRSNATSFASWPLHAKDRAWHSARIIPPVTGGIRIFP